MAYIITRSDGTEYTVNDNVIDETFSSPLLGRDVDNYGDPRAQDMLRTLENFAHTVPPRGAIKGQLWFDTGTNSLKYYDGDDPSDASDNRSLSTTYWKSVSGISTTGVDTDLVPAAGTLYNLGSPSRRWHYIYGNHGNFSTSGHTVDTVPALTVSGFSVFTNGSTLRPDVNATNTLGVDLGENTARWKTIYTRDVAVGNNLTLSASSNSVVLSASPSVADTIVGVGGGSGRVNLGTNSQKFNVFSYTLTANSLTLDNSGVRSHLIPDLTDTRDLGAPSSRYRSIHGGTLYEDGQPLSARYAPVGGSTGARWIYDLLDVKTTNQWAPNDGQVLTFNVQEMAWVPGTSTTSGVTQQELNTRLTEYTKTVFADIKYVSLTANQTVGGAKIFNQLLTVAGMTVTGNDPAVSADTGKRLLLYGRVNAHQANVAMSATNLSSSAQTPCVESVSSTSGAYSRLKHGGIIKLTTVGTGVEIAGRLDATNDVVAFASDERLKENITTITGALDSLANISGVRYNFNDIGASHGFPSDVSHVGLLAQEVEKYYPEIITLAPFDKDIFTGESKSGNEYKTIRYDKMVPVLVEAIKEADAKIATLEQELAALKEAVNKLMEL